jgi:hypothetical protein
VQIMPPGGDLVLILGQTIDDRHSGTPRGLQHEAPL